MFTKRRKLNTRVPDTSRTNSFGITLEELKNLMEKRGEDGIEELRRLGGISKLSEYLISSPIKGICSNENELKVRRREFGSNVLPQKKSKTFMRLVWESCQDVTLIVLEFAALISLILAFYESADEMKHRWIESSAIIITVFVVVIVTAFNDWSKEKQFQGLKRKIEREHKVHVIRCGIPQQILAQDVVVGDVCQVKYGDLLPADGILIQSNDLKIDESSLTGESNHVKKEDNKDNFLLSGTQIMEGSGKMLVTAVGIHSQSGIIYTLLGAVQDKEIYFKGTKEPEQSSSFDKMKSRFSRAICIGQNKATHTALPKKEQSVLQAKLSHLAIRIGYAGSVVALLTTVVLLVKLYVNTFDKEKDNRKEIHLQEILHCIIIGVTVLVVAIPEGLPLAVTISLAFSVKKMMKDNILVRHIDACETMGNATTICCDKTGTLTTNRMTVVQAFMCDTFYETLPWALKIPEHVQDLIVEAISVNSAYTSQLIASDIPSDLAGQIGNKTECALLNFLEYFGKYYQDVRNKIPEELHLRVYTFNSSRKYMGTVIPLQGGGYRLYAKGAAETIVSKFSFIFGENGELKEFKNDTRSKLVNEIIKPMTSNRLRTIAVGFRDFVRENAQVNQVYIKSEPNWDDEDNIIKNLTGLCVVGIEDPLRPEAPESIKICQDAGITVRMITGDNMETARSIALQCGILNANDDFLVMDGKEFNLKIKDDKGESQQYFMDEVWPKLRVLARSSPADKYNLVKGIKESKISKMGEVVAVTGDGTNDGPALKIADVGLAMGISGTDVAKEASDIIVVDDNFRSIVKAVLWGRNVYDSIAKFLQFQLTVNVVAVVIAFTGACAVHNTPLKAVQMLWVNLIMDSLASLALANEIPTASLLLRKPYGRTKTLLSKNMLKNVFGQAFFQLTILFILLFSGDYLLNIPSGWTDTINSPPSEHFTIIFNTLVMMTLFNEINTRKIHGERNVFQGIFSNPLFCCIWIFTFALQILIVQFGGVAFSTAKLSINQWLICLLLGSGALLWGQILIFLPFDKL